MTIRTLISGEESQLENFLAPYTETCMFMLSNLRKTGLVFRNEAYCGEYIADFSPANEMRGVLVQFWNGSIMAHAVSLHSLNRLIAYFKNNVHRPITGIVGENQTALHLVDGLGFSRHAYTLNQSETLYGLSLTELHFSPPTDEHLRKLIPVCEIDRELIRQWLKDYEIEALGRDDDEELAQRVQLNVSRISPDSDQWVLLVNDIPVSLCGFNARLPEIVQIGPVWTPPIHRNKGYARYIVAWTLYHAKQISVKKSVLFTNNPAAARAYQSIGFGKIGQFRLALLKNPCFPK